MKLNKELITLPSASKQLGISNATLHNWIKKGMLKVHLVDGVIFTTMAEVKEIYNNRHLYSKQAGRPIGKRHG